MKKDKKEKAEISSTQTTGTITAADIPRTNALAVVVGFIVVVGGVFLLCSLGSLAMDARKTHVKPNQLWLYTYSNPFRSYTELHLVTEVKDGWVKYRTPNDYSDRQVEEEDQFRYHSKLLTDSADVIINTEWASLSDCVYRNMYHESPTNVDTLQFIIKKKCPFIAN